VLSLPDSQLAKLAVLPRFYDWRTLQREVFANDRDAMMAAYLDHQLPPQAAEVIETSAPWLPAWLAVEQCRLLRQLLAALSVDRQPPSR
jgi:hypothetical protein